MHNYQKTLKEEMKSICFLIGDISYRGGAERITLSVASKLAIKNKVTILSIAEFKVEDLIFDIHPAVQLETLNVKNWGQKSSLRKNYVKIIFSLRKFIIANSIDNLVNVQATNMLWTLPALLGVKVRTLCWEHSNFTSHKFLLHNVSISLAKKFADKIIVLTERDRVLWNTGKAITIANFPAFNMPDVKIENKQKIFIAVGRFSYEKAFDRLIDIWEIVEKSIDLKDYHLAIFGEGDQESLLKDKIVEKGLKKIAINPFTKDIDLVYNKASSIFMTSLFEGYPMVLIEALQFAVPAIAFDVLTGPAEIIEPYKTGFLIADNDLNGFAEKIIQIIEDEQLLYNLKSNCLEHRKKFKSDAILDKWNQLLN